jgi:hypothetical protein
VTLVRTLIWEAPKEWLRTKGIFVSLALCVTIVVLFIGWSAADSSRNQLSHVVGLLKRSWLRLLSRLLKGPQVVLEYDWDGCMDRTTLRVSNNYNTPAYDVQVSSLYYGLQRITFRTIPSVSAGFPVALEPSVGADYGQWHPMDTTLGRFIRKNSGSEARRLKVFIEYQDAHGTSYETKCEIVYDGRTARSFLRAWGRKGSVDRSTRLLPPTPPQMR